MDIKSSESSTDLVELLIHQIVNGPTFDDIIKIKSNQDNQNNKDNIIKIIKNFEEQTETLVKIIEKK